MLSFLGNLILSVEIVGWIDWEGVEESSCECSDRLETKLISVNLSTPLQSLLPTSHFNFLPSQPALLAISVLSPHIGDIATAGSTDFGSHSEVSVDNKMLYYRQCPSAKRS
jgi:hypothetical protein